LIKIDQGNKSDQLIGSNQLIEIQKRIYLLSLLGVEPGCIGMLIDRANLCAKEADMMSDQRAYLANIDCF
jgi:hypothetical protein